MIEIQDTVYTGRNRPQITYENIRKLFSEMTECLSKPQMIAVDGFPYYIEFRPKDFESAWLRGSYPGGSCRPKKRKTEEEREKEWLKTLDIFYKDVDGKKLTFAERNILNIYLKQNRK